MAVNAINIDGRETDPYQTQRSPVLSNNRTFVNNPYTKYENVFSDYYVHEPDDKQSVNRPLKLRSNARLNEAEQKNETDKGQIITALSFFGLILFFGGADGESLKAFRTKGVDFYSTLSSALSVTVSSWYSWSRDIVPEIKQRKIETKIENDFVPDELFERQVSRTWGTTRQNFILAAESIDYNGQPINNLPYVTNTIALAKYLFSPQAPSQFQTFFNTVEVESTKYLDDITNILNSSNKKSAEKMINEIHRRSRSYMEYMHYFSNSVGNLEVFINMISESEAISSEVANEWKTLLCSTKAFVHDMNNISNAIKSYTELANRASNEKAKMEYIKSFPFDLTSINGIMQLAKKLNAHRIKTRNLNVSINEMLTANVALPKEIRVAVFRIAYELVLNAIKYADEKKAAKGISFITIKIWIENGYLCFSVYDNGVGIKNIRKAIHGKRQSKHLAHGQGLGLQGLYQMIKKKEYRKHLMQLKHRSDPNNGTTATFRISTHNLDINRRKPARSDGTFSTDPTSQGDSKKSEKSSKTLRNAFENVNIQQEPVNSAMYMYNPTNLNSIMLSPAFMLAK